MQLYTKNGHDLFEISSLLQKAIRRGDDEWAGYAVNELRLRYNDYLWRRLLLISAEDCWGIITKEIMALRDADEIYNKGKTGDKRCGEFLAKATTLLLKAFKNRDSDWFACNLVQSEETLDIKEYLKLPDTPYRKEIPKYAYDVHTARGKMLGMTREMMVRDEQKALSPKIIGDYDNRNWDTFFENMKKVERNDFNNPKPGVPMPTKEDLKELKRQTDGKQETLFG